MNTTIILLVLCAFRAASALNLTTTTLNYTTTWCTKKWEFDTKCPISAICVPTSERGPDGEDGFCSCGYYDSGFKDRYDLVESGAHELRECVTTTLSGVSIAWYGFVVFCSVVIASRYGQLMFRARRDKIFRWDVLGTSTFLLFLSSVLLAVARIFRIVVLTGVLNTNRTLYNFVNLLHIITSVVLTFVMVSGTIFFAVSTLGILSRASVMMGMQVNQKHLNQTTGKRLGVVCGLGIAIGVCICSFTNQYHINALVVACGAMMTFLSFGFLARSVTSMLRTRQAHRNEELRIPALHIISSVSRRLTFVFVILLACSVGLSVCWVLGRANRDETMLQYGLSIVVMVQYGTILTLTGILGMAVSDLWAFKLKQSHMIKRGISVSWKEAAVRPTVSGVDPPDFPAKPDMQRKPSILESFLRRTKSEAVQTRDKHKPSIPTDPSMTINSARASTSALKTTTSSGNIVTPMFAFGVPSPILERGSQSGHLNEMSVQIAVDDAHGNALEDDDALNPNQDAETTTEP